MSGKSYARCSIWSCTHSALADPSRAHNTEIDSMKAKQQNQQVVLTVSLCFSYRSCTNLDANKTFIRYENNDENMKNIENDSCSGIISSIRFILCNTFRTTSKLGAEEPRIPISKICVPSNKRTS